MGLLTLSAIGETGTFAIWQITEPISFFENKIDLFEQEKLEISTLPLRRRMEWMSTRYLLHEITPYTQRMPCLKDAFGKPYLGGDAHFISLSHSGSFAAAIRTPVPSGIDIQLMDRDILRIAPKFMNDEEYALQPQKERIEYSYMLWSAKEAMYKAYGQKEIDFRTHMNVLVPNYRSGELRFEGTLKKDDISLSFTLFCKLFDRLMMVYAVQQ